MSPMSHFQAAAPRSARRMASLLALLICWGCSPNANPPAPSESKRPAARLDFVVDTAQFSRAGDRFAALASVDQYADPERTPSLEGPGNDMDALARTLATRYGFAPDALLRLHGPAATRRGILNALSELEARAAPGVQLVFAFAGHGSFIKDAGETEEGNGQDETICPYDRDLSGGGDILDDELHRRFTQILARGAFLTVILDACYSGSAGKPLGGVRLRTAPPARVTPALETPVDLPGSADKRRFVFLASAQEEQEAGELWFPEGALPAGVYGVFVHALNRALRDAPEGAVWGDLRLFLETEVAKRHDYQRPVFRHGRNREIFGAGTGPNRPFFRVREVLNDGAAIRLDQGAMGGVAEGALLAVYAPGERRLSGEKNRLGLFRVEEVGPQEAVATLVAAEPSPRALPQPGCYAALIEDGSSRRHRIFWDEDAPAAIADGLTGLIRNHAGLLARGEIGAAPGPADFRIALCALESGRGLRVEGVTDPLTLPLEAGMAAVLSERVQERILRAVAWDRVRRIHNPRVDPAWPKPIEVTLTRGRLNPHFQALDPLPADGRTGALRFREGDAIQLSYRNVSERPLYVTILYMTNQAEIYAWNDADYDAILEPGRAVVVDQAWIEVTAPFGTKRVKALINDRKPFDPQPFLYENQKSANDSGSLEDGFPDDGWLSLDLIIQTQPRSEP